MRTQSGQTSRKRRQSESRVQESYQVSGFSAGVKGGKMVGAAAAAGSPWPGTSPVGTVAEEEPLFARWCQISGGALVLKLCIFNQPGTEAVPRPVSTLFCTRL